MQPGVRPGEVATAAPKANSSFFSNIFGQRPSDEGPSASVLAEWNKYSAEAAGPSQTDKLMNQMEEGSTNVNSFFNKSFTRISTGAQGLQNNVQSQFSNMPSTTTYAYFFAILAAGIVMLLLAFTLFLPVVMLAPSKFAITFTLGSLLIMSAFVSLKGWRGQLQHMLTRERLPFTIAYVGSMGGTLYAAMAMHSYVLSIICCAAQVVALLYYILSYFPGGTAGMKFVMMMMYQAGAQCTNGMRRLVIG